MAFMYKSRIKKTAGSLTVAVDSQNGELLSLDATGAYAGKARQKRRPASQETCPDSL